MSKNEVGQLAARDVWSERRIRLERIKAKMEPFSSRRARISARFTKPDCVKCGGEDFMHLHTCPNATRGFALNPCVAFGQAVAKAAAKHEAFIERRGVEIMAQLKAALGVQS